VPAASFDVVELIPRLREIAGIIGYS